jgi:hypothetical protein
MADKLSIYNGALRLCKTRKLASLTDNSEPRRLLDAAWDSGGAVRHCLETGQWSFATRAVQIDHTPSIEPDFGYRHAFIQPGDMVRPVAICEDAYFANPLLRYSDERKHWFCDLETIYVRYVSDDPTYGGDLSVWSSHFEKMVEAYLATEIVGNLTHDKDIIGYVNGVYEEQKKQARALDAMNKPTVFLPEGTWLGARRGRMGSRRIENGR